MGTRNKKTWFYYNSLLATKLLGKQKWYYYDSDNYHNYHLNKLQFTAQVNCVRTMRCRNQFQNKIDIN